MESSLAAAAGTSPVTPPPRPLPTAAEGGAGDAPRTPSGPRRPGRAAPRGGGGSRRGRRRDHARADAAGDDAWELARLEGNYRALTDRGPAEAPGDDAAARRLAAWTVALITDGVDVDGDPDLRSARRASMPELRARASRLAAENAALMQAKLDLEARLEEGTDRAARSREENEGTRAELARLDRKRERLEEAVRKGVRDMGLCL